MREWEKNIRKVTPYVPGEQPKQKNVIKLNTNENPYPPSPKVTAALQALETDPLRKYPDPAAQQLTDAIADFYGLKPEQVFVGVGSDDVLAMCFLTFFNSQKPILFPDITYSFYDVWADLFRIPYECQPLNDRFEIVKEDYYRENGGVIFPNPNAPTGELLSLEAIEDILKHNQDVVVIVDEAYIDFGGGSALPLLERYENLLMVQTFSKSRSMAGMRIGYALGSETLISTLEAVKNSYNSYTMDAIALAVGEASIRDEDYFQQTCRKVSTTRDRSAEALRALGFTVLPSLTNFLFVTHPNKKAPDIFAALREKGIFIRYFKLPRIDNYLRITVGTDEQMDKLIAALKEIL